MLGDDALILAHRLSEWGLRAGMVDEAVAFGDVTVDLLRQADALLFRAGELDGSGRTTDEFAFGRPSERLRNIRLVEIDCGPGPNGDFASTVVRLLLFTTWRLAIFDRLVGSRDPVLATVAAESLHWLREYREHTVRWVARLAQRTPARLADATALVWPLTGEAFHPHEVEERLAVEGCAVNPTAARPRARADLHRSWLRAGLDSATVLPEVGVVPEEFSEFQPPGGRAGVHTAELDFVLAEMRQRRDG